ncbi:winged helix-turn-helix transcriptional regulator [Candidatus Woesearchaeota archaeon]|nr:winged helix-turn-helix transcriptional regulator [Candidatus Woesearchaeota archaeon]
MGDFSKKDLWMLFELNIHARSPLNKIAKKLKMSQQGISYKIEKFEESGVITGYSTVFDYACLGYHSYKVLMTINQSKTEQRDLFFKHLSSHSSVISITELGGHWDFFIVFATKNASRCNKEIHILLAQFPKLIKNYYVLTNTVTYDLKRRYLTDYATHMGTIVIGGDRDPASLLPLDKKIIFSFYENPRVSYVQLASKYKVTPKTIISRVRALETKGVIKSYTTNIDCSKLGYNAQKIFLKLSNVSLDKEEELIRMFRRKENVISISKVFGMWDFELDVECASMQDLHTFLRDLRVQLGDIIREMELCHVVQIQKQTTLPQQFFSEL